MKKYIRKLDRVHSRCKQQPVGWSVGLNFFVQKMNDYGSLHSFLELFVFRNFLKSMIPIIIIYNDFIMTFFTSIALWYSSL